MNFKKALTLIISFIAVFSCVFVTKPAYVASAGALEIEKVAGHASYNLSYILKDAGVTNTAGKIVKYRLTELADGTAVAENDSNYPDSVYVEAPSAIEFKTVGTYTFDVYSDSSTKESSFNVKAIKYTDVDKSSFYFVTEPTALSAVQTAVNEQAETLVVGEEFNFSNASLITALENVAKSKHYPYSALTKTYYYATPQSTAYASTTSSKFKLPSAGTYSFYVLLKNEVSSMVTTDDLVEGPGGWYAKDSNGNRTGSVIIPIFTFNVEKISAPIITVSTSESGFINLEYTVDSFTIKSDSYKTDYKLYYNSTTLFDKDDDDFANDDAYINAVINHADTVEVTTDLFDKDKLSFTPNKKGYYYVLVKAVDSANLSEEAMSRVISVQKEYSTVKIESEFFKNNVLSVVCLSIACVALIAIIILLTIKPKEESEIIIEIKK